jgi:hypothetical protein
VPVARPAEWNPRQHAREHLFLVSRPWLAALLTSVLMGTGGRLPMRGHTRFEAAEEPSPREMQSLKAVHLY